jgi:hypothetical protein
MKAKINKILFWTPRLLSVIHALFISLLALDVFCADHGFWQTLIALAIHLIPTVIIVAALLLAWRWERIGTLIFFALGGAYMILARGNLQAILFISGPLVLIGILFFIDWCANRQSCTGSQRED